MLAELTVRNLAVIEETRLTFGAGLNVITGETGAGKSLLVDALAFVLGGAADRGMMRRGADSTSVEAIFAMSGEPLTQEALAELGVEVDDEDGVAVLYREVHKEGRTVSRLNGRAVPVSTLRAVGGALVDIHGQGSHLSLLDPRFQMRVLDDFDGLTEQRNSVERAVAETRRLQGELGDTESAIRDAEQRRDLLAFQVEEIEAAAPIDGEEESLLRERNMLEHAESVRDACAAAYHALSEGDRNAADLAAEALDQLRRAPGAAEALAAQVEALESALAQLSDVAREVRNLAESVESDPARLAEIEERVELLRRLKRKYGGSESAVLAFAEDARAQLERIETADERREALQRALEEASRSAGAIAVELSDARRRAAAVLSEAVAGELREVGLERASFDIAVEQDEADDGLPTPDGQRYAFSSNGIDRVTFTARTNPGEESRPLAESGLGRRDVAHDAGAQQRTAGGLRRAVTGVRRDRRGHRQPRRRGGGQEVVGGGPAGAGALRDAPAADSRLGRHALPCRQGSGGRADVLGRGVAERCGAHRRGSRDAGQRDERRAGRTGDAGARGEGQGREVGLTATWIPDSAGMTEAPERFSAPLGMAPSAPRHAQRALTLALSSGEGIGRHPAHHTAPCALVRTWTPAFAGVTGARGCEIPAFAGMTGCWATRALLRPRPGCRPRWRRSWRRWPLLSDRRRGGGRHRLQREAGQRARSHERIAGVWRRSCV